jgi:hypothetical protein
VSIVDDDYLCTNSERAFESAKEQGLRVDLPGPTELFIDLDTDADRAAYERSKAILVREYDVNPEDIEERPSRGGTGTHVRINMPKELTPLERIAFQAALGSDCVRELLSLTRLIAGDPHPTLFFEKEAA